MNLTVTGHHVDVTESMRNYVKGKMDRLQRHSARPVGIQVTLTVEKERRKAEATVDVAGNHLFAETTETDMYAAIDLLADKLDKQLIRQKEKMRSHRHDASSPVVDEPAPLQDEDAAISNA